jgi:hypothetical protein
MLRKLNYNLMYVELKSSGQINGWFHGRKLLRIGSKVISRIAFRNEK